MKKIAVIGSPGAGKTTIASGLFYNLKILGKKAEIVPELIKYKVYDPNINFNIDGFDEMNTKQQQSLENVVEKAPNMEYVICEAPLCNGYIYSSFYKKSKEIPFLKKIAQDSINSYDLIIFVKHSLYNEEYETFGRKEDQKTSLLLEKFIEKKIKELNYKNSILIINQGTNIQRILYSILDPKSYSLKKEN